MPGLMIRVEFPARFTAMAEPATFGTGKPASGSAAAATPVTSGLDTLAPPLFWTAPTTCIAGALSWTFPLADMALDEVELTMRFPGILRLAFPETVRAPLADVLRT